LNIITIVKSENWVAVYVNDDLFVSRICEIEPCQWILIGQKCPDVDINRIIQLFPDQTVLNKHNYDYCCPVKLSYLPKET
jgi:hypothetical protein